MTWTRCRHYHYLLLYAEILNKETAITDKDNLLAMLSLERPTLASRVPLFLLGHFLTNECEISDFCL